MVALVCCWVLCSGLSGYVDPRKWALPAVVGLTFPLAVIALCVTLLAALLSRCRKAVVAIVLTAAIVWQPLRVNAPINVMRADSADSAHTFTLLTFNVMGFDYNTGNSHGDVNETMRYILDADADVVVLQETSLGPKDFTHRPDIVPLMEEIDSKYPYYSHGYHDLVILSRYPYRVLEDTTLRNAIGAPDNIHTEYHAYAKVFDISMPGDKHLRVVNVHMQSIGLTAVDKQVYRNITHLDSVQSREQMRQVRHSLYSKLATAYSRRAQEAHLLRSVIDLPTDNLIVCGDFNDTPAGYCYWTVRGDDLDDAYAQCGNGFTYTYNSNMMLFNIDHVLYRGNIRARAISRDRAGVSDHYPLLTTFEWL